jgi:hypothetical protein
MAGKFKIFIYFAALRATRYKKIAKMVFNDQAYTYSSCMRSVDVLCEMLPHRAKELRIVQASYLDAVRHIAKVPGETTVLFETMAERIAGVLSFSQLTAFAQTVCDHTMRTTKEL